MGILDSKYTPGDFLLPFLRLPALRMALGFTTEEGGIFYSEDLHARQFAAVDCVAKSTAQGVAYVSLNGVTSFLSAADAAWNSPTKEMTAIVIHRPSAYVGTQGLFGKIPTLTNQAWGMYFGSGAGSIRDLRAKVSLDGTPTNQSVVTVENAILQNEWTFSAMRFTPSAELKVWSKIRVGGSVLTAVNNVGVVSSCFDSTAALNIGRTESGPVYYTGDIALAVLCAGLVDDGHMIELINHAARYGVA